MKRGQGSIRFFTACLTAMLMLVINLALWMPPQPLHAQGLNDKHEGPSADVIWILAFEAQEQRIDAKLGRKALLDALRKGGYILYFRHATTDRSQIDSDRVNLKNCATQRNLSEKGREQSKAIGKAFKARGIKVAEVITSPYCRCIDTARLAFGEFTVSEDLVWTLGQPEAETKRLGEALRKLLGTKPSKGTNTVLVSHMANIKEAVGIWPEPEGVAHIFQPTEDGGFSHLGKVLPEEWAELIGAYK